MWLIRGRRFVLGAASLVGIIVLIVLAVTLAETQRDARQTVEQRFAYGSGTAAALVQTVVSQAYRNNAAVAQSELRAPTLSSAMVRRVAARATADSVIVLDARGQRLAAFPASATASPVTGAHLRQALAGRPAISGALGHGGASVIEVAVPFDSSVGRRVLVVPTPLARVQEVLGPYLTSLPGLTGHRAFIIGPGGGVLADSRPQAPRDRALTDVLRSASAATQGSYDHGAGRFSSSAIHATSWRLVDTASASALYAPVDGWPRWLPWIVLAALVPAVAFIIVLADRAGRGAERARQASEAKSAFLASMSHELRTPMTTVIGFSEMLYEGKLGPLSEQQSKVVGHITTSSKHLNVLISEVLDLSRVEEGRLTFHPEDAEPHRLVAEVADTMSGMAEDRGIHLHVEAPDIGTFRLDAARFKQVLYNLIGNAIKFTEYDGHVTVQLRAADHGELAITVTDDGPGIPAADMEKIFLPFEQGVHRNGGAGLGLAVSRRIVDAQGGRIDVASPAGQGATFTVTLPPTP
jgi:signal transduction histidine kinase